MKRYSYQFANLALALVLLLAACGGGTSPTGAPVNAPAPPTTVSAGALSDKSVQIRWTDNSSDETGFSIERSLSATGTFTQVGTATINATSHIDSGLTPATAYHYRLKATGSTGDSAYTAVVTASTPAPGGVVLAPLAPSGLTVNRPSVGAAPALNVAWTDNSSDETAFLIERASSTAGPFVQITAAAANVIFFQDAGLMSATTYCYRARASKTTGDSAYTNIACAVTSGTATPVPTIPAAPTGMVATASSSSSVALTWADASNNETGFKIERAASAGGTFTQIALVGANVTSYSNTALSASTAYYYRVRATNSVGDSAYTAVVTATTTAIASASTTVSLNPSIDNVAVYSSVDATRQTTAFPTGPLAIGCDWNYFYVVAVSGYQQHANCKQSLLQFNLAALAGKTIDSATLTLTASQVPAPSTAYSPRNWFIGTATQAWGSGVTWNTTPGYYLATAIELSPPTAINQVATVNLTAMVQAWTNGSLPNYGLQLAIGNYNLPNPLGNSWDTFYLYSTEEPTVSLRPTLTITYR